MDVASLVLAIVGVPATLKETVKMVNLLRLHIQHIKHNPELKAELDDRVSTLHGILTSLNTEPDDKILKFIIKDLRNVDKLVRSVSTTRKLMRWLMSSEYHARLQKAEKKLQSIITQCLVLQTKQQTALILNQQSAFTVFNPELDPTASQVGLDRSAPILKFLKDSEASEQMLRVIIIHGQGGIGKSTLLSTVWGDASLEALFPARAFAQVGEHPTSEDISELQSKICKQLYRQKFKLPEKKHGKADLVQCFQKLKDENEPIFLAIDNIFEAEHLTSILPFKLRVDDMPASTCIVVTCKDTKIGDAILSICRLQAKNRSQVLFFEPPYLNPEESKKLFAECAGMELTDPAHQDLLNALSSLCGGLPMALEFLGRRFVDERLREPNEWRRIMVQWNNFDDPGDHNTKIVSKAFRSSYDELHPSRRVAFLDIVSSFYGWPWELVEGIFGEEVTKNLRESSFIKKVKTREQCSQSALGRRRYDEMEEDRGTFKLACISGYVWVHDLTLRLGERMNNDKVKELLYADGKEHQLGYVEHSFLHIEDLPDVTKLRNLILRINSATSSRQLPALLSYLQEAKSLQTLIVQLEETLDRPSTMKYRLVSNTMDQQYLRYFSHTGQWDEAWSNFLMKVSPEIRFMRLCNGKVLELLPNTTMPRLQMLKVSGYTDLQKFEGLPSLKSLNLKNCKSLAKLPVSVGCMEYLEHLELSECNSLVELPSDLGKLRSLKQLYLLQCHNLKELPESIGCMEFLEQLWLVRCLSLLELPAGLGKLRSLKHLYVFSCKSLTKLLASVECLESLEELTVMGCPRLVELPADLGKLRFLKDLNLWGTRSLKKLPEPVECMESLEILSAGQFDCIAELLTGLGKLPSLKRLYLSSIKSLTKLLESVGCIESLQELHVSASGNNPWEPLTEFPTKLRSLKILFLSGFQNLRNLECIGCMESLESLEFRECGGLEEMPAALGKQRSLKKLCIRRCGCLTKLQDFKGCMESLEILELYDCFSLVELPADLGEQSSIKELYLSGCKSLMKLPQSVGGMKSLKKLWVENCSGLMELPADLGKQPTLNTLHLEGCTNLKKLPESVSSIRYLEVTDCDNLADIVQPIYA